MYLPFKYCMFILQQCGLVWWEAAPYSGWPVCNLGSPFCHYMTEKAVLTLAFGLWHSGKHSVAEEWCFAWRDYLFGVFLFFLFFFPPVAGQIKLSCFAEGKRIIYYYYLHSKLVSFAAYTNLIGGTEKNYFNCLGWLMMSNFRL